VDNLTRSLSPDLLSNLIGPFTDFLRENNPRMSAILGNLQTVSTQMAQGEGTVGKMLSDDQLYVQTLAAVSNLNTTADDIRLTVAQARGALEGLANGQGTLGRLAQDDSLFVETTTAMVNLREVLEKINRGQGSVGKLVNDEALFNNAKMTLQKLDKATEGLEDQGPLSILGIAVNGLF
jgi:phospholipid/cholesterol/gamma-HCH transport system substrate-binding protein